MRGLIHKRHKNRIEKSLALTFLVLLFGVLATGGCSERGKDSAKNQNGPFVYCIDQAETKIVQVNYTPKSKTKEDLVKEYLEALSVEPDDITLKRAIPDGLYVEKAVFSESGLSLKFNSAYNNLTGITEVLARACIIKTLCQIEGVDDVSFYVGGSPLTGLNGNPIGFKNEKDFIDGSSAEDVYITVYFANEKGNKLVPSDLKVSYDGNMQPIEKTIIGALMEGPVEANMKKCIPDGTRLLKVTTKDGICYVDFNENFLNKVEGVKAEVVLYSVINSLDELSTVNKVQFTINGSTKKTFQEDIPFDGLFERNLDLIAGDK
ncbi:GerMN domain-containing protein [Anaerocolumna xylanovorans]|uniref:Germination protein M n=1 Tax=Anaerocolumna xylanovorans DSM 12503 TaxID=1121345 RepID=A0A1M7YF49_9FIRM|nr:GerMN domain-containing protein [Anaerocolumna xylanovorans]SHO51267.1 germination protein M [Anaerocolumna xylanovorans DSM 12503]